MVVCMCLLEIWHLFHQLCISLPFLPVRMPFTSTHQDSMIVLRGWYLSDWSAPLSYKLWDFSSIVSTFMPSCGCTKTKDTKIIWQMLKSCRSCSYSKYIFLDLNINPICISWQMYEFCEYSQNVTFYKIDTDKLY